MHPQGRAEGEFHPECETDDDGPEDHDHRDDGTVSGIDLAKVQPAVRAGGPDFQQVLEQWADTATGAPASQGRVEERRLLFRCHPRGYSGRMLPAPYQ